MCPQILFWDVDTQHDFMDEDGKLAVPGAQQIVPNLHRLTRFAVARRIPIIATGDAHDPDDREFEQFGQHCVAGTPGQRKIPQTVAEGMEIAAADSLAEQLRRLRAGQLRQLMIEKKDLDVFTQPAADEALRVLDPDHVYVYGVATEYCVLRAVLGIRRRGYPVTVVTDAVKPIAEDAGSSALSAMRKAGARAAVTDQVLRQAQEG